VGDCSGEKKRSWYVIAIGLIVKEIPSLVWGLDEARS